VLSAFGARLTYHFITMLQLSFFSSTHDGQAMLKEAYIVSLAVFFVLVSRA
jgi:hypothetical protein